MNNISRREAIKALTAGLITGYAAIEMYERLTWEPRKLWSGHAFYDVGYSYIDKIWRHADHYKMSSERFKQVINLHKSRQTYINFAGRRSTWFLPDDSLNSHKL